MAAASFVITAPVERATAALAVIRDAAQSDAVGREGPARLRERLAAVGELAAQVLREAEAREAAVKDAPPPGKGWRK